ncbi:hypothetical protein AAFC00_004721 [Neodothiora populina]|uniref:Chalcone isomerase domain-containing protein n=1 Tax=Neodothiora populina TaxID=2781224 RepID=A0ABR3P339_9PEZI
MSRPAMRMLSARLRTLQRSKTLFSPLGNVRSASRYSQPGARPAPSAPAQKSSFEDLPSPASANPALDGLGEVSQDTLAAQREFAAHRARALQRMRFAGIGLLLSVAGLSLTIYNLDLDDIEKAGKKNKIQLDASSDANDKFQGRDVHVIGAGEDKRIIAEGEQETELVQTGSGSVPYFPRRMYLVSSKSTSETSSLVQTLQTEDEYTLVGLGIRTVTFLSIEVYCFGMYVRTQDIAALQSRLIHLINPDASTLVPSEKEQLRQRLLDPAQSIEIWETLLREEGIRSVWRIVPSKNTDFAHLRDGWINGIKRATAEVKSYMKPPAPGLTEYDDESFGAAVKSFRDIFTGGGRAPKGSVILLLREPAGAMEVLFHDPKKSQAFESIGKTQDPRIGRLIWLAYLAGKSVSSESARKAVVDGYVGFAARPLGTVETMVR